MHLRHSLVHVCTLLVLSSCATDAFLSCGRLDVFPRSVSLQRLRRVTLSNKGVRCSIQRETSLHRKDLLPILAFSFTTLPAIFDAQVALASPPTAFRGPNDAVLLDGGGVKIPAIGFGTYNTKPEQVGKAVETALMEGMRGFDCASAYGNEREIGMTLKQSSTARSDLVLTSKVANKYHTFARDAILRSIQDLAAGHLDLVLVHSPLTGKTRRLQCYEELLRCKEEGLVRSVGTCNFGVSALSEIVAAGLPAPSVNQLELSPFNQRKREVQWCREHGTVPSSASWSKLSNKETGAKNWARLKQVASAKGATPQQVLIAWSLQRGFPCNPRAAADNDKDVETIRQNFSGMRDLVLSSSELASVDSFEEGLRSGALGRRDGWTDEDVTGSEWDPTLV